MSIKNTKSLSVFSIQNYVLSFRVYLKRVSVSVYVSIESIIDIVKDDLYTTTEITALDTTHVGNTHS